MLYSKPLLTPEEAKLHAELLALAGGIGCPADLAVLNLNEQQRETMLGLNKKGYLSIGKQRFMLLLPVG